MAHEEEKLIPNHTSPEHKGHYEIGEAAGERLERLEKSPETKETEQDQQKSVERAREEAEAIFSKEANTKPKPEAEPKTSSTRTSISRHQKEVDYKNTIKGLQSRLSSPSRAFSKTIHQPAVEKTSDAIGATVARPNAILAGSLTAFIAVLGVYLLARYNGFRLSGFETIAAFVVGWIVGVILDLLRVIFKRHRTS